MRETEDWTEEEKKKGVKGLAVFAISLSQRLNLAVSL